MLRNYQRISQFSAHILSNNHHLVKSVAGWWIPTPFGRIPMGKVGEFRLYEMVGEFRHLSVEFMEPKILKTNSLMISTRNTYGE